MENVKDITVHRGICHRLTCVRGHKVLVDFKEREKMNQKQDYECVHCQMEIVQERIKLHNEESE
jgi:hypothetical protein